jgi:hypothetical protein
MSVTLRSKAPGSGYPLRINLRAHEESLHAERCRYGLEVFALVKVSNSTAQTRERNLFLAYL